MNRLFDIVVIGPQGSGKGTQAEILSAKLGIPTVSAGQLLRKEIEHQTELGKRIQGTLAAGELVPPELVTEAVYNRFSEPDALEGMIIDGYPRSIVQLESFDSILAQRGREVTHVIFLDISDKTSLQRLAGRRTCTNTQCGTNYHVEFNLPKKDAARCDKCGSLLEQRGDDTPEAISRRLQLYHQETAPLIEIYRNRGVLVEINGEQTIADVASQIAHALQIS